MERAGTALPPFIEQCREWCQGTASPWLRLQRFVGQMTDRLRIRDSGGRVPATLPEEPAAIAVLCYWHGQWILGMCPTRICENTVSIACACRAFLLARELCPEVFDAGVSRVFEELLDFTYQVETTLLMDLPVGAKSLRLESLAESIYHSCERLPRPEDCAGGRGTIR